MLHLTCWVNLLETNVGLNWTQEFLEKPSPTFSSNFKKSKGYGYGCFGANLNHVSQMRHQEWGWEHQNLRTTNQKLPQQITKCANQHEEIYPNFHGTNLHIFKTKIGKHIMHVQSFSHMCTGLDEPQIHIYGTYSFHQYMCT